MKSVGTIIEWINKNPKAILTNPKFLQEDVGITDIQIHVREIEAMAPFGSPGSNIVMIRHAQILFPYVENRKFPCTCQALYPTSGCMMPLTQMMIDDPNWEESVFYNALYPVS